MRTREELNEGCAELLKKVRLKKGLSMNKIADLLYMDAHKWARYESGESAPTVPEFIEMFDILGIDALKLVLDYLYPDEYDGLNCESSTNDLRDAITHYFGYVASDRIVREWCYLVHGEHGSNIYPQMQEFTMIDHLPMKYRLIIARQVLLLWELSKAHGELVGTEHIMPDIDAFMDGLYKGEEASMEGRNSYTTSSKEE